MKTKTHKFRPQELGPAFKIKHPCKAAVYNWKARLEQDHCTNDNWYDEQYELE